MLKYKIFKITMMNLNLKSFDTSLNDEDLKEQIKNQINDELITFLKTNPKDVLQEYKIEFGMQLNDYAYNKIEEIFSEEEKYEFNLINALFESEDEEEERTRLTSEINEIIDLTGSITIIHDPSEEDENAYVCEIVYTSIDQIWNAYDPCELYWDEEGKLHYGNISNYEEEEEDLPDGY